MQTKAEIIAVLLGCQRIAEAMAEFYDRLATLHAVMAPDAARVWRLGADSHRNRGFQIRFAIDNVEDMVSSTRVGMEAIHKANAAVNHIVLECKRKPPSLEQAARVALEFEHSLRGTHLDTVAIFSTPRHTALFRAMLSTDRDPIPFIAQLLGVPPVQGSTQPAAASVGTHRVRASRRS